VEEVKALRSRLEELCQQTLYYEPGEEGQMEDAEAEEEEGEEEADADLQPPLKRKVTIRSMEGDRLPGGRTMSEDAALRWALRCAQSSLILKSLCPFCQTCVLYPYVGGRAGGRRRLVRRRHCLSGV